MSEGDRKMMKEARRTSTYQATQKNLFLMFKKMFGAQNDDIKDSDLFSILVMAQSTRKIKENFTLASVKCAPIIREK